MTSTSDTTVRISSEERMLIQKIVIDDDGKQAVALLKKILKRIEKPERQAIRKPS